MPRLSVLDSLDLLARRRNIFFGKMGQRAGGPRFGEISCAAPCFPRLRDPVLRGGRGSAVGHPLSGQSQRPRMPETSEIEADQLAGKAELQEYGVANQTSLRALVDEPGQRLARWSRRRPLPWHFTRRNSPESHVFALPGGDAQVTRQGFYGGAEPNTAQLVKFVD